MTKRFILLFLLAALVVGVSGCKSNRSGSKEYIPGKGWVPND
jgi:hypothetical protein